MRDMAHSICLIKLYQIKMRKKFQFFVSDYLNLPLIFNQSKVVKKDEHTHLGMILDSKLNFNVREAIIKVGRGIGIMYCISKYISRDVLDQIYKLYVRPHLDYGDIICYKYDPEYTLELTKKLEFTQLLNGSCCQRLLEGDQHRQTLGINN